MICCKIIADYNNPNANFGSMMEQLSVFGDVLWDNGSLYFGDTHSDITEKKIINIFKKNHYTKFFVDIYDKDNQPKETEYINGWINDKLIKINYRMYEQTSQEVFHNLSNGLDMLQEEARRLLKEAREHTEHQSQDCENEEEK